MKKIIALLLTLMILAAAVTLTACGDKDESKKGSDAGSSGENTEEAAEQGASIENDFPAIVENNPNGHMIVSDNEYMYFLASRQKYSSNEGNGGVELCRMKKGGGEKETVADVDQLYCKGQEPIAIHDGYIYIQNTGSIDRINIATGEAESGFIDIAPAADIENDQNNVDYSGYGIVQNMYFVDTLLIYNYEQGNDSTSANKVFTSAYYDFESGNTVELEMDIRANTFAYDEEHIYMYDNNDNTVNIIPLAEFKAGKTNPEGTDVVVAEGGEVSYIASNGIVVKTEDNRLLFYQFKDALALGSGEQWEAAEVIAEALDSSAVFYDDHYKTNLYMTNDGGFGYGDGSAYRFDSEWKIADSIDLVDDYRCGFIDGELYLLGYDDAGVYQAQKLSF